MKTENNTMKHFRTLRGQYRLFDMVQTTTTRRRTGSDPDEGAVVYTRTTPTRVYLSVKEVEQVGVAQAFRNEMSRYWRSIRTGRREVDHTMEG